MQGSAWTSFTAMSHPFIENIVLHYLFLLEFSNYFEKKNNILLSKDN
jgi:hypothetical protein